MSNKIQAYIITILLFGGIALWLFGTPNFSTDKFSSLFTKETVSKKKKKRRVTNSSGTPIGTVLDSYKGVKVYFNGPMGNVTERNLAPDGYNLGLKYQCVEFAKRFFYEAYNHKMPDPYGNAVDFYDTQLSDGAYNQARGMYQFTNGSKQKPRQDDLLIIGGYDGNMYGHLVVITKVDSKSVHFIQQNPGSQNPPRSKYKLLNQNGKWRIDDRTILGWLSLKPA